MRFDLGGARPAHAPGPGPLPEPLLRALELTVRRRAEGLLAGEFRSHALGAGTELAQVRPYRPGDDVRQIDWNVTARTGEPHVRVHVAERSLTTWLVLDVSPSMTFGTADRRKADVAEGVAVAVAHLASRRGNRLGLVTFGGEADVALPPRQGRRGLIDALVEARRPAPADGAGATSLAEALRRAGRLARSRALVFLVSDFRTAPGWQRPLLELAGRHDVIAVEIRDRREDALPDVGHLRLVDPETGAQLEVDTGDRRLRERFAAAAAAERAELAAALTRSGADHMVLETSGDWLRRLAGRLARRRGGTR
jgi:uncharacterized protein (DUF58 family)